MDDSEEEKLRKDRARQERRIKKDIEGRRLNMKRAEMNKEHGLLAMEKQGLDAADRVDDGKIQALRCSRWASWHGS